MRSLPLKTYNSILLASLVLLLFGCNLPTIPALPSSSITDALSSLSTGEAPFLGQPQAVPGTIEAVNYDLGGQGVGYYSPADVNYGGSDYRPGDGVSIRASLDGGNDLQVGWTTDGEWLAYTVNVMETGSYTLSVRAADGLTTPGQLHLEVDGVEVSGPVTIPSTGSYDTFADAEAHGIPLTAGLHVLRLVVDQDGFDLHYFTLIQEKTAASPSPSPSTIASMAGTPFDGPHAVPGTVQAADFDQGGQGVGYYSPADVNYGESAYRAGEGVSLRDSTDGGDGLQVGWTTVGEWLDYTVTVATEGDYAIGVRTADGLGTPGQVHLEVDGANTSGAVTIPVTADYNTFTTVAAGTVHLAAGEHRVRLVIDQNGFDLRSLVFASAP